MTEFATHVVLSARMKWFGHLCLAAHRAGLQLTWNGKSGA